MVLGLLVARSVVGRISAVVAEFVLIVAGHVSILEIAVVILLVGRSGVLFIGHHGGDYCAQQQNLQTNLFTFLKRIEGIKNFNSITHHESNKTNFHVEKKNQKANVVTMHSPAALNTF